jgi:hypothetical protein
VTEWPVEIADAMNRALGVSWGCCRRVAGSQQVAEGAPRPWRGLFHQAAPLLETTRP